MKKVHVNDKEIVLFQSCLVGGLYYLQQQQAAVMRFKRDHPVLSMILMVTIFHYLAYKFASIIVILMGIALPVTFVIVHAALR